MKFLLLWKWAPVFVFKVNFLPNTNDGLCLGFLIFIKSTNWNDSALLEHELVHSKQFYKSCGVFLILWCISKKWRYKYELEAYREQLQYIDSMHAERAEQVFATYLSTIYRLPITYEQALADLRGN